MSKICRAHRQQKVRYCLWKIDVLNENCRWRYIAGMFVISTTQEQKLHGSVVDGAGRQAVKNFICLQCNFHQNSV